MMYSREQESSYDQDTIAARRTFATGLERNTKILEGLVAQGAAKKTGPPWWASIVLGAGLTIAISLIAFMYQGQERNRVSIDAIRSTQDQRAGLPATVKDLQDRMLLAESRTQAIPALQAQLGSIDAKLDRLIERFSRGATP